MANMMPATPTIPAAIPPTRTPVLTPDEATAETEGVAGAVEAAAPSGAMVLPTVEVGGAVTSWAAC